MQARVKREARRPGALLVMMSVLAVLALAVIGRILAVAAGVDPWLDEAMLLRNLPARDLLAPLPLYHQAAPLGYLALANLAAGTGNAIVGLRVLSVVFSLAGLIALAEALRWLNLHRAAALALALVGMSRLGMFYSVEIKQYGVEAAFTAILCAAGAHGVRHSSLRASLILCAALVAAVLGSFTAPVAAMAIFLAMLAEKRNLSGLLAWAWPFAVGAVAFAVQYVLYAKPVTAFQFAAYRDLYEFGFGPLGWLRIPALLLSAFTPVGVNPLHFPVISAVFWVVVLALAWRVNRFFPVALASALLVSGVLNIVHVLPALEPRHFIFLLPLSGTVLALAAVAACDLLGLPRQNVLLAAAAILAALTGLYFARHSAKEQVSPLLAAYGREGKGERLWVFPMAQPVVEILGRRDFLGRVPERSAPRDWLFPVYRHARRGADVEYRLLPGYPAATAASLAEFPAVWMLFGIPLDNAAPRVIAAMQEKEYRCQERAADQSTVLYRCAR
jgi:hypothetical protein